MSTGGVWRRVYGVATNKLPKALSQQPHALRRGDRGSAKLSNRVAEIYAATTVTSPVTTASRREAPTLHCALRSLCSFDLRRLAFFVRYSRVRTDAQPLITTTPLHSCDNTPAPNCDD